MPHLGNPTPESGSGRISRGSGILCTAFPAFYDAVWAFSAAGYKPCGRVLSGIMRVIWWTRMRMIFLYMRKSNRKGYLSSSLNKSFTLLDGQSALLKIQVWFYPFEGKSKQIRKPSRSLISNFFIFISFPNCIKMPSPPIVRLESSESWFRERCSVFPVVA